jgi:hypothetical protein
MRKWIIALLLALFVLCFPGAAQASTTGPFVKTTTSSAGVYVRCHANSGPDYSQFVPTNSFSDRGCVYIGVYDANRILYKSLNTGALYWTACGQNIGDRANAYMGWYYLGGTSSVEVEQVVTPPECGV